VANDYGRLSAADRARLKRARKRAGVKPPAPVRGESASEKARVAVQGRARDNFEKLQRGEVSPANFARSIAGLKPAEKRDLGSYSKASSERTQKKAFSSMVRRTPGMIAKGAGIPAGLVAFQDPDFVRGAKGFADFNNAAVDALTAPGVSRRERLEAAANITSVAGLGGGVGKAGKGTTPPRPTALPDEAKIAAEPWRRWLPVLVNPRDPSDIRFAIDAFSHADIPRGEVGWYQATAVIEDGKVAQLNFGDAVGSDEFGRPILRPGPDASGQKAALETLRSRTQSAAQPPPPPPSPPSPPRVSEPGGPNSVDDLLAALPEAKALRRKQEAGYRKERTLRAAKIEEAMKLGGTEGHQAALRELKGELPKLKFGALEEFDQEAAEALFKHAQNHEGLRPYEKISTVNALKRMIEQGKVPTKSEIKLIERTFGPEVSQQIVESAGFWQNAKNMGLSIINVPRAMKSSYDISAPFRQGLVLGARHPKMFASEFRTMLKSFKSESFYDDVMDDIATRPTYETMQKAKLQLTDLENLSTREEGFMSNIAEEIPVIGRGVRASGRAYTAFLNKFRADAFDNYLTMAEKQGLDIEDTQVLKGIASWVNHATGRGSAKSLEGAMAPLNAMFFSPRLIMSRVQLLNPAYYAKLDPFARKQALQGMGQLLGAVSLTLYMAKLAGAEVGLDPRSADFAKIKVGDTRIDIAGGFQQYLVAGWRLYTGESVNSAGEVRELEGGFGNPSRYDIAGSFAENKLAPVPGYGVDWSKNENFAGDPFDPVKETARLFVPLGVENAYEGFKSSPEAGIASATLGSIGFGTQTYDAAKKRPKPKSGMTGQQRYQDALKDEKANAKKLGLDAIPQDVKDALKIKAAVEHNIAVIERQQRKAKNKQTPEGKRFKLTAKQRAAAVLAAIRDAVPDFDYAAAKADLDSLSPDEIRGFTDEIRREFYSGVLREWHSEARG
jgi:hypothetical protein